MFSAFIFLKSVYSVQFVYSLLHEFLKCRAVRAIVDRVKTKLNELTDGCEECFVSHTHDNTNTTANKNVDKPGNTQMINDYLKRVGDIEQLVVQIVDERLGKN